MLMVAVVLTAAALNIARPMISYRALALGGDVRTVGLVAAAFALLPAFAAVPLGHAARDNRLRWFIVGGMLVLAAAAALLAQVNSIPELAVWSAALGMGHLGLMVGIQSLIAAASSPSEHDRRFGLFAAGEGVGQLIGPALGGALVVVATDGAAVTTAATSRALLAAAGLAALALPATAWLPGATRATPDGQPSLVAPARLLSVMRSRGVGMAVLTSIATLTCIDLLVIYLPVVGERRGISAAVVGVILSLRALASTLSRLFMPYLTARIGRVRVLTLSLGASVVPLVAMPAAGSPLVLGLLVVVAGWFLGTGQPLTMSWIVSLVPQDARSRILSIRLAGNRIGQMAAPALAGVMGGAAGVGAVFWLMGVFLAATCGLIRVRGQPAATPQPTTARLER